MKAESQTVVPESRVTWKCSGSASMETSRRTEARRRAAPDTSLSLHSRTTETQPVRSSIYSPRNPDGWCRNSDCLIKKWQKNGRKWQKWQKMTDAQGICLGWAGAEHVEKIKFHSLLKSSSAVVTNHWSAFARPQTGEDYRGLLNRFRVHTVNNTTLNAKCDKDMGNKTRQ